MDARDFPSHSFTLFQCALFRSAEILHPSAPRRRALRDRDVPASSALRFEESFNADVARTVLHGVFGWVPTRNVLELLHSECIGVERLDLYANDVLISISLVGTKLSVAFRIHCNER